MAASRGRLQALAIAVLLVMAGWCGPATSQSSPLARFHAQLSALEAGRAEYVTVLQIGDSHTANDHLSGRLRAVLQQRFGDGGRGFLQPGTPFPYFRPYQIDVTQSAGWRTLSSNKSKPDEARFGLAGYVARAEMAGETIAIDLRGSAHAAIEITVNTSQVGGTLTVSADGRRLAAIATRAQAGASVHKLERVALPTTAQRIVLAPAGDGPVEIVGYTLVGAARGIRLASLGFPGAQVGILGRWDWPLVAAEIKALDPALIIVAFGTNEGFAPTERIASGYAAEFERHVAALKLAAPNGDIVIVGPPDASRFPRYCLPPAPPLANLLKLANAALEAPPGQQVRLAVRIGAVASAWASQEPPPDARCVPLASAERARYDVMLVTQDRALCRWHTPAAIPIVREAQRIIAAKLGVSFFDWGALFGGECGADDWTRKGLAHKDRVHLKQEGYARAADRLHDVIMAGYPARTPAPRAAPAVIPPGR